MLVTGGAGFAGSYVINELLTRGHGVVCFDLSEFRPESRFLLGAGIERVVHEKGSIDDWPRVIEVTLAHRPIAVIHAGANMDTGYLDRHPTVAAHTNLGGTLNLLEAAGSSEVSSASSCFSTIGVIGRVVYEPIDANHPVITARRRPTWCLQRC